jgi:hypothetical protein
VNEDDKKAFLEDFKNGDINQKLDMWFYALDQGGIWEELLAEMSNIATVEQMKQMKNKA